MSEARAPIMIRDVVRAAADLAGVTPHDITRRGRGSARLNCWRMAVFAVARERTARTYKTIGHHIGRRDHSTVMYGIKRADPALVDSITRRLG